MRGAPHPPPLVLSLPAQPPLPLGGDFLGLKCGPLPWRDAGRSPGCCLWEQTAEDSLSAVPQVQAQGQTGIAGEAAQLTHQMGEGRTLGDKKGNWKGALKTPHALGV